MSSVADLAKLYEASDVDRLNRRIAALEAENAELRRRLASWCNAPLPKPESDARWLAVYGAYYAKVRNVQHAENIANAEREERTKGERR